MPRIESWDNLPANVRQHLIDRMRERTISIADLNQLRLWITRNRKCRTAIGTKTSVHLKSAAAARTPRRFCCTARPQKAKPCDKQLTVFILGRLIRGRLRRLLVDKILSLSFPMVPHPCGLVLQGWVFRFLIMRPALGL
jgi:hypothetical protein